MAFFILTRVVLVKYSRAFVERPSQGTSSLALQLTTVSLDIMCISENSYKHIYSLLLGHIFESSILEEKMWPSNKL